MFTINSKSEKGFNKIILEDESNGTFAEIIPSCGAILHAFTVVKDKKELNVIESYESEKDFKKHVASKGFLGTKLSPFVCRIKKGKYEFQGKEYKIEKYYIKKNALHGILYDQPFSILEQHADKDKAYVSMMYEYRASDAGYPFNYNCIVTYQLEKNNRLNIITEVINKAHMPIPIQDGWHPYFTLGSKINDLQLQFQSNAMIEFDKDLIPTGKLIPYKAFYKFKKLGKTFFDNCFRLDFSEGQPMCILQDLKKKIEIEIHNDESYPFLQLYTPTHRKSIAIENISSVPDAFNNKQGLTILSPGESATFKTAYKISLLT